MKKLDMKKIVVWVMIVGMALTSFAVIFQAIA